MYNECKADFWKNWPDTDKDTETDTDAHSKEHPKFQLATSFAISNSCNADFWECWLGTDTDTEKAIRDRDREKEKRRKRDGDKDRDRDRDKRFTHTHILSLSNTQTHTQALVHKSTGVYPRGGGLGSSTIFKNLMSPTPHRKWYLTTGRRAH